MSANIFDHSYSIKPRTCLYDYLSCFPPCSGILFLHLAKLELQAGHCSTLNLVSYGHPNPCPLARVISTLTAEPSAALLLKICFYYLPIFGALKYAKCIYGNVMLQCIYIE